MQTIQCCTLRWSNCQMRTNFRNNEIRFAKHRSRRKLDNIRHWIIDVRKCFILLYLVSTSSFLWMLLSLKERLHESDQYNYLQGTVMIPSTNVKTVQSSSQREMSDVYGFDLDPNVGGSYELSSVDSISTKLKIQSGSADNQKFLNSLMEYGQRSIANKRAQKHPRMSILQDWDNSIAFPQFFYFNNTRKSMKSDHPDYGNMTYHSIKNDSKFTRVILDDSNNYIVPGAFDAQSIEPTSSLKERNRKKNKHASSYPFFRVGSFNPKSNIVRLEELGRFYDDDQVSLHSWDNDGEKRQVRACHSAQWEYNYFPTCNCFHEIDLSRTYDDPIEYVEPRPESSTVEVTYLNHGFFRDVWVMEDNPWLWPHQYKMERNNVSKMSYGVLDEAGTAERIAKSYRSAVLKTLRWTQPMDNDNREMINIEAVVMERLTKSPRIMDIYGHCGYSVYVEMVPIELEEVIVHDTGLASRHEVEKRNEDGIHPYNNFTVNEKLKIALSMAESIADLHGFEDGVIVHDDVQLCQWLRFPDGRIKLGDFNRAYIMQYDIEHEQYCKFNNGEAFGNYRSPEEFAVKNLDEKIDVFSFGNNIYALLTGLWGFYDLDDEETQDELINGELPYIDPRWKERSFVENRLIELMLKCWVYDPAKRVDIFYAVDFLKETVRMNNELKTW